MIDVGQWHCAIGVFMFSNRKPKCARKKPKTNTSQNKEDLTDLCGRLFVLAITFWAFNLEYQCIHYFTMDTNPNCLILAGDVESNPGPTVEEQIQHLQQSMQAAFDHTHAKLEQFSSTQQLTLRKVDAIQNTVTDMQQTMSTMQTRIKQVEDQQHTQQLDGIENAESISKLEERLAKVEADQEKKAREERKPNIILHDVPEQPGADDSNDSVISCVVDLFNQNVLTKVWNKSDLNSAFRMGRKDKNVGKTRPILISFCKFTDKMHIIKAREHLKTIQIGVSNDHTPFQRDELSNLKRQNKFGYYKQGKLCVVDSDNRAPNNNNNKSNPRDNNNVTPRHNNVPT